MRRHIALIAIALSSCALLPAAAQANTPILSYTARPSNTQAGGHPDVEVQFSVANRQIQKTQSACNCQDAKDATVHLPTGFIGNPEATPQCSIADFSADECPIDSQTGVVEVSAGGFEFVSAVYNVVPPPDVAGLIAFKVFLFDTPQFTVLTARTDSDYGLDATATSIFHGLGLPLESFRQDLWGVPADPIHDPLRLDTRFNPNGVGFPAYGGNLCDANGSRSTADPNTIRKPCIAHIPPAASNSPDTPFLQNATTCETGVSTAFHVLSYDGGTDDAEDAWPAGTGCEQLSFNPSLYAQPTTNETDSASGIDVNLTVPQQLSPTVPSPTELKAATVTLPAGFSINPNAADGKTACSNADAHFETLLAAECPEISKVGSLEIDSSALPGPLPGFVYLGEPLPGNRYRIFLVADGFATHIKLPGTVTPDPTTGQLVITFENLPQSPLTAFNMHFFGSERGLLATPTQCGSYGVTTVFTPWDESLPPQSSTQFFTLERGPDGAPCPGAARPFSPTMQASSLSHSPGAHAPFDLELNRNDGDQNLSQLSVKTPPGFSATVAGVPYCSDAALAQAAEPSYTGILEQVTPSCPVASQIGTAVTGAGAGSHPLYVPGKVYLAGPYKGAPLSLAVITPAVSGPYDLGNVVVRAALEVDTSTAQITAVSDPLPLILGGIPLRLRSIRIDLDRPEFALNPTNCEPHSVDAEVHGDQGAVATLSQHYQVANCRTLPFAPALKLKVSGGLTRTANPAFHAVLETEPGEANIASTQVTLPRSLIVDNSHIGNPCTRKQLVAESCPDSSLIGSAKAVTPLLAQPLEGPVYLTTGFGHQLPDVVADLKGQIHIFLDGKVDAVNGRNRTTFETVPDAPVSKFELNLLGGKKGLLINTENLCKAKDIVTQKIEGQNGRNANSQYRLQTPCGSKARHKRHNRNRGAR